METRKRRTVTLTGGKESKTMRVTKTKTINDLPNEILILIFSHLSALDIKCSVSRVSVNWCYLSKDPNLWRNVFYTTTNRRTINYEDKTWTAIKQFLKTTPQLQHVIINRNRTVEEIRTILLVVMKYCTQLRGLEFNTDWHNFPDIFKLLPNYLKSIQYLKISLSTEYDNECLLQVLEEFSLLKQVVFLSKNPRCSEFSIFMKSVPHLQHLNISNDIIKKDDFTVLESHKDRIKNLSINVSSLTAADIAMLNSFKNLATLRVVDKDCTVSKLTEIGKLKCLKGLHLQEDPKSSVLTPTMLIHLFRDGRFDSLEELKLIKIRIDDEGTKEIRRNCRYLRYLDIETYPLSPVEMTDSSLLNFFHCPQLYYLEVIFRTSVTNDWLFRRNSFSLHDCEINEDCPLGIDTLKCCWDEIDIPVD